MTLARGTIVVVQLARGPCYATLARDVSDRARVAWVYLAGAPVRVPRARVRTP